MKNNLGDKVRLKHISDAINEIENYINNVSFESFESNSMMLFATIKQLEIIGEAANRLSPHFKRLYNEVLWKEIVGLRNILIHEYFGVDVNIIWNILKKDIPELKIQIDDILKQLD